MYHAFVNGVGLLLILVNSSSGWPEVILAPGKSSATVKQMLRVIFSSNGGRKTLVSDNTLEFYDKRLNLWLRKMKCTPYKIPPYHPQLKGIAERMVQNIKACPQQNENVEIFLPRLLLSYCTIPPGGRLGSAFALMRRQI